MNYAEGIVLSLFDMFMIVIIILKFRSDIKLNDLVKGAWCVLFGSALIGTVGYILTFPPIGLMCNTIIVFLIIWFLTKLKFRVVAMLFVFSTIFLYGIQFVVMIIYKVSLDHFEYAFKYGLISQVTAAVTTLVLIQFVPIKSVYYYIVEKNKWFSIIIINLYAIYYMLLMLWYTNLNSFYESIVGILILVCAILIVNAIILKNGLQNQITYEKVQIYETYMKVIEDIIEDVRVKQHDYHNQIQAIEAIVLKQGANKDFQDYRKLLIEEDIWAQLLRMDNKILTGFFYSKYHSALIEGIKICYQIDNYLFRTQYTDYELVEIFGILIDNAIEATSKKGETNFKVVIGFENGMNVIQTINKSDQVSSLDIKRMFEYQYTTKKTDGHGVGLYKIKKILKKRNGTISVLYDTDYENIEFTVLID